MTAEWVQQVPPCAKESIGLESTSMKPLIADWQIVMGV
jgi:hypothetical protein